MCKLGPLMPNQRYFAFILLKYCYQGWLENVKPITKGK